MPNRSVLSTLRLAFCVALFSVVAFGQEPFAVKGDVLGEPLLTYQQNNPNCRKLTNDKDRGSDTCKEKNSGFTYAGVIAKSKAAAFLHDRLYQIVITVPHVNYATVDRAVIEKYGKPGKSGFVQGSVMLTVAQIMAGKDKSYQERLDVPEIGETAEWKNGVSTLNLEEYDLRDPSFSTTSIMFSLDSLLKEATDNMNKAVKSLSDKAKSDQ